MKWYSLHWSTDKNSDPLQIIIMWEGKELFEAEHAKRKVLNIWFQITLPFNYYNDYEKKD